jgi:uncharacterized UPF0160 family protein
MKREIKTIATHWGGFHADEVFAVAIMRILFPKIKVIRVDYCDSKKQLLADIRIDVGRKYNCETGDYDHHQPGGAGERKNGIPYASCGLIWKKFGIELAKTQEDVEQIDRELIQTIDAIDNGFEINKGIINLYTISSVISSLNPKWPNQTMKNFNRAFEYAVTLAIKILKEELRYIKSLRNSEERLKEFIDKNERAEYLILSENLPWQNYITSRTDFKIVIEFDKPTGKWFVNAVPAEEGVFKCRIYFPKIWGGLAGRDLEKASGISGAMFCHRGLHFAVADSKGAAIKMAEEVLRKKEEKK